MIEIFQTLVVVSLIASGIYVFAMGYYFHKNRGFFWEGITCFCMAICINIAYNLGSFATYTEHVFMGLSHNVFLCFCVLVNLGLNRHSGYVLTDTKQPGTFEHVYEILSIIMLAAVFAVPASHVQAAYYVTIGSMLILCFYNFLRSMRIARHCSPPFYLNATGEALLFVRALLSFIDSFGYEAVAIAKLSLVELYLIIMILMFSAVYRLSIKSTKALSNSLAETITTINHSSNALLCTQMKSDFLYASLELISRKCDEDPWTAEDLTISLSKYLRHTLNFQQLKGIVPLSNEIELTKAYIAIERERHPNITFDYNLPNPIPDFHIPPLSIQPLVENAIEHAFLPDAKDAHISITISDFKDYYHIDVSDNGVGMDEDYANALTDSLHDSARIGVYSIHTRLSNLFGKGLVIQSAPGVGSSISFVVPPNALDYVKEAANE